MIVLVTNWGGKKQILIRKTREGRLRESIVNKIYKIILFNFNKKIFEVFTIFLHEFI